MFINYGFSNSVYTHFGCSESIASGPAIQFQRFGLPFANLNCQLSRIFPIFMKQNIPPLSQTYA